MAPYLFAAFVVILIVFAIYAWRQEQKRREALRLWCHKYGWKLAGHSIMGWDHDYPGISVFSRGHSKSGDNIITGHFRNHRITLLDYQFTTGSGKNRTTHHRGVTIMESDFPTIPLQIRREHAMDKLGAFLGAGDIEFESAEFNRKFFVKSSDRKWAYDVVHTGTMEYLLSAPKYSIEYGFGEIAIYRQGKCNPEHYEQQVEMAWQLLQLIPEYLVKEMKGQ